MKMEKPKKRQSPGGWCGRSEPSKAASNRSQEIPLLHCPGCHRKRRRQGQLPPPESRQKADARLESTRGDGCTERPRDAGNGQRSRYARGRLGAALAEAGAAGCKEYAPPSAVRRRSRSSTIRVRCPCSSQADGFRWSELLIILLYFTIAG
ncbi:hypothetical protein ZWY2020_040959 [Hordeum vulgare]|nr:hypothetical protein ZWY2020_040959 [Hordeum vulgare]